jgi:membrane-associated phospholipid phosphatase
VRTLAGTRLLGVGAACFVALAIAAGVQGAPLAGDIAIAKWIQHESLVEPADVVDLAGDHQYWTVAISALAVVLRLRWRPRVGGGLRGVAAAFLVAAALVSVDQELKDVTKSGRPEAADGIEVHETSGSYGFPSGHTFTVAVALGTAAALAGRRVSRGERAAWVALAVLGAAAAGSARIILGAHWPSDVLGGLALGAAGVGLCLATAEMVELPRAGSRKRS